LPTHNGWVGQVAIESQRLSQAGGPTKDTPETLLHTHNECGNYYIVVVSPTSHQKYDAHLGPLGLYPTKSPQRVTMESPSNLIKGFKGNIPKH